MKHISKIISGALSAVMLIAGFTGCGKSSKTSGDVKELTLFLASQDMVYDENLPIWKAAEKKTGIRLINTVSSSVTDETSSFSTMLLSKKLPDIIRTRNDNLRTMMKDGGLVALDEYFDVAPNLKKFFDECGEAKSVACADDGHIYFVPGTTTDLDRPNSPSSGFFIRKDWLEKLNLQVPKTIGELHDVLYAFKTRDPNGNGIDDEVPYFQREKKLDGLLCLFCTSRNFITNKNKTKVEFGPVQENYKEAVKELSKWYSEGLIDSEIYSRSQAREMLLGQNLGGCTTDWFSSTGKFNESYADAVPGLNFAPILPPENINGEVTWPQTRGVLHGAGWGISKDCDKDLIEDAVKYLDFWMSEEGCDLMAYGVEGISYTKENGKIVWSKEALNYADGLPGYRRSIGMIETGTVGKMEAEKAGMNDVALEGYEMYEPIVDDTSVANLSFTDKEQELRDRINGNIETYVAEQQQKWLMGKGDVEAEWDEYLKQLEAMGLNDLISITQAAYDRKMALLN